jgi:hypothetical protein
MEKQPDFIREFSKEEHQAERDAQAAEIRAKRSEYFNAVKETEAEESERQTEIQRRVSELTAIRDRIKEIETSGIGKLLSYFELRSLRAQLAVKEPEQEEYIATNPEAEKPLPVELDQAKELLHGFYEKMKTEWIRGDYSPEEIKKYFTEENLAGMNLEDYALLLRRFPKYQVTHVTRQGVRDHIGHIYHQAGTGEFAHGFEKILGKGRLRSALSLMIAGEGAHFTLEESFCKPYESEGEALRELGEYLDPAEQGGRQMQGGTYADSTAIHFAGEDVADCYYGSERGNEIFIVFPSALVINEYGFSGLIDNASGGYWNDIWVWPKEQEGIDINAGLVFIPKNAEVDPKTGSRYKVDDQGQPIERVDYLEGLANALENNDFREYVANLEEERTEYYKMEEEAREKYDENIAKELTSSFGIDPELAVALTKSDFTTMFIIQVLGAYRFANYDGNGALNRELLGNQLQSVLMGAECLFAKPDSTCTSEEYWEKYLAEHPEIKYPKIIYYEGDPAEALFKWRKENGIVKEGDENYPLSSKDLGRDQMTEAGLRGSDRFRTLMVDVIHEYFSKKKNEPMVAQSSN